MGGSLRVMSYNLRDFTMDRHAAARVIRRVGPDVLCLQEVPRRLFGTWRVAAFARECGLQWAGPHRGSGGTTIFTSSKVQAHSVSHRPLPVARWQRTRGYAVARVSLAGQSPILIASVHLGLDADERERHAAHILATLGTDESVVVAGDLNEDDSGNAWRRWASTLRLVSAPAPTFPADAPQKVLDVIFASPGLPVGSHVDTAVPEGDLVAASDHRPVWVDIWVDLA